MGVESQPFEGLRPLEGPHKPSKGKSRKLALCEVEIFPSSGRRPSKGRSESSTCELALRGSPTAQRAAQNLEGRIRSRNNCRHALREVKTFPSSGRKPSKGRSESSTCELALRGSPTARRAAETLEGKKSQTRPSRSRNLPFERSKTLEGKIRKQPLRTRPSRVSDRSKGYAKPRRED